MPEPPVSVTARAVSSTDTMPVQVELVEEVLLFVMPVTISVWPDTTLSPT
ncbi:hypothetical protein OG874_17180 [Nocardia sp. NBC_00565]|nr:hypothetical protein [Nocardia sp. NBC_00565]WUC06744.1 hypothetical protein OG874_17180 [Nocardia sp. NBC_00565]